MIVSESGFFAQNFPVLSCSIKNSISIKDNDISSIFGEFSFSFENAGYMMDGMIHTAKVLTRNESLITLRDILERNVSEKYYLGNNFEKWEYLKGSKRIERTNKNGHKYTYSEGAIPFPDPLDLPARTILTSESYLNRSTHIVCDPQTNKLRILTPLEVERIQGFDDGWTNTGMPEKFRYFCMGNALVVPMVTRMGKQLNDIFSLENASETKDHIDVQKFAA